MRKSLLAFVLALGFLAAPVSATPRIYSNTARHPYRLLIAQFSGNTNMFTTTDPSPASGNLTETSATGMTQDNDQVTVTLTSGFTAPVTLTAYYWRKDTITPANSCWVRLGANSGQYSVSVDTNYATATFTMPRNTAYIIMSSAAVTGNVYVDTPADPLNNNSAIGY